MLSIAIHNYNMGYCVVIAWAFPYLEGNDSWAHGVSISSTTRPKILPTMGMGRSLFLHALWGFQVTHMRVSLSMGPFGIPRVCKGTMEIYLGEISVTILGLTI